MNSEPAKLAVIALTGVAALRIGATGMLSLFRANREYGRLVFYLSAGEVVRILSAIAVCVWDGDLVHVAVASSVSTAAIQVIWPVMVAIRRFSPHRLRFALLPRGEAVPVFGTSGAFFAQSIPIVLLTSLPVLYLGRLGVGGGMLAAFVLMRTLSGAPRALLQQLSAVLGLECGRRIAVSDPRGAFRVVTEGARFYSVLSGLASGLLIAAGWQISLLWTGSAAYFRLTYMIAAVAPMLFAAFAVLAHNILTTTNAPMHAARARWAQLILTIALVLILPQRDSGLAMLVALSLAEMLGFVPFAYYGVLHLVPRTNVDFHLKEILITLSAAALAAGITVGSLWLIGSGTKVRLATAIVTAVLANGAVVPWIGMRRATRHALLSIFVRPGPALSSSRA